MQNLVRPANCLCQLSEDGGMFGLARWMAGTSNDGEDSDGRCRCQLKDRFWPNFWRPSIPVSPSFFAVSQSEAVCIWSHHCDYLHIACTMIHTTMDHNVKINPQLSKKDFFTTMTMLGKRSVQLLLFLIQSTNSCLDVDCQQFQSPMVDFYLPCGLNEGVCLPWSNGLFTNKQVQTELETKDLDFTSRSCLEIGNTSASCGKITTFNLSV